MTVIGSQGFFTSVLSGSLMHATEGNGCAREPDCDPSIEIEVEQDAMPEVAADSVVRDPAPADRPAIDLAAPKGEGALAHFKGFASECWEWFTVSRVARDLQGAINERDWGSAREILERHYDSILIYRKNVLCQKVIENLGAHGTVIPADVISCALYLCRDERTFNNFITALESLLSQGRWEQAETVLLCVSKRDGKNEAFYLHEAVQLVFFGRYVQDRPDSSIPTFVIAAACALMGNYERVIILFRQLCQRGAWKEVCDVLPNLAFLEQHSFSLRNTGGDGATIGGETFYCWDEVKDRGGVLAAVLPHLRAGTLPSSVLSNALKLDCGSNEELSQLCDLLVEQRDWEMLRGILEMPDPEKRHFVAQRLLKAIPLEPMAFRRFAIPEWLEAWLKTSVSPGEVRS